MRKKKSNSSNDAKIRMFSLTEYIQKALEQAEYERDESGYVVASVPNASGFFTQGRTFEEARENLRDAIEGNVLIALQMGFEIPRIKGVRIKEVSHAQTHAAQTARGHAKTA
jgi:predicted RNase H-like HicB family nuclease